MHVTVRTDGTQGMAATTPQLTVGLFDSLRERETQARIARRAYGACMAPVASPDSMLYWLGSTCRKAREAAGRKGVSIAASVKPEPVDQSTISRFEKGLAWPRDADKFVNAYADDLDIDALVLWTQAVEDWHAHRDQPAVDLATRRPDLDSAIAGIAEHADRVEKKRREDDADGKRRPRKAQ